MNISTEDFINFYSIAVHPKSSQISPICISPFTSNDDSLHVQVLPIEKPTSEVSQSDYPSYKIIKDENCFYQISTNNLMTLVQKISQNHCVWNIPAFFPSKFVAASLSNELLFIGLLDKTINIVDTNTGVCCFPSVFVDDKIIYLISEDNYVICFTSNNMLMIWEIVNNQYLRSIIHEKYEGPELGTIQKVILTNELSNDSISPIIFAENITVRFSKTRNGWINANCNIPAIFGKRKEYRTIYDVEKGFFKSLINDEIEEFHNCLTILLQKYLKSKRYNRVSMLVMQLLDIISNGKTSYCGMNPKELLEFMLKTIGESNPEMVDTILKSQNYHDAFNPKPSNTPQQPKETPQEIPQSSILQPSNSNITPEQQEVIDIIYKNQQNIQASNSIITQPSMPSIELPNQSETFTWPNPNLQTQSSTQNIETPVQISHEQSTITHDAIITSPNTQNDTFSPPKIKSYNEDDGLMRAQKYVSESLPTSSIINEQLSPIDQETKKIIISPPPINALDIVSSESIPVTTQKPSVSSPNKTPKKRTMKQGTLADFIQISPKKSDHKKAETPIVEEKKTKSTPKRKGAASQNTIQATFQNELNESEMQNLNNEQEENSQSQSLQQRRSPRVPHKLNTDQSPEPKKKTTKAQQKKKAVKANDEEEQQQQQQQQQMVEEGNENEEIHETQTQIKTPNKKTPKKTNKKTPKKALNFFVNENETAEQSATQQPLPVTNLSQENQILQPSANSEEPNPLIIQPNLSEQNQVPQPIQQYSQAIPQQPQLNIQFSEIPQELLNDPSLKSTPQFKQFTTELRSQIIEYQKQHNITPKRKARATKPKNMSQTTQIPQIQSQQNEVLIQQQQQQSAELIPPSLQSLEPQSSEQQTEGSSDINPTQKKTPKKKSTTPRKAKNTKLQDQQKQQQEQQENVNNEQQNVLQNEFITSLEGQEGTESSAAPLKKQKATRAKSKKANSKSQEANEDENNEQQGQVQAKKKTTRQKKTKEQKAISQAPQLSIQNDDEKLSVPASIEQNKLTIQEAQEIAEKMQQDNS